MKKLSQRIRTEYPKGSTMSSWAVHAEELEDQLASYRGVPPGAAWYSFRLDSIVRFRPKLIALSALHHGRSGYEKMKSDVEDALDASPTGEVEMTLLQMMEVFGPFLGDAGLDMFCLDVRVSGTDLRVAK